MIWGHWIVLVRDSQHWIRILRFYHSCWSRVFLLLSNAFRPFYFPKLFCWCRSLTIPSKSVLWLIKRHYYTFRHSFLTWGFGWLHWSRDVGCASSIISWNCYKTLLMRSIESNWFRVFTYLNRRRTYIINRFWPIEKRITLEIYSRPIIRLNFSTFRS